MIHFSWHLPDPQTHCLRCYSQEHSCFTLISSTTFQGFTTRLSEDFSASAIFATKRKGLQLTPGSSQYPLQVLFFGYGHTYCHNTTNVRENALPHLQPYLPTPGYSREMSSQSILPQDRHCKPDDGAPVLYSSSR